MEQYIFPATFYRDEENDNYIVAFDDIQVYCCGKSVEEAYYTAKKYLKEFCRLSLKMFGQVQEKPRSYLEAKKLHKNEIVLLVDAEIKNVKKAEEEI